MYPGLKSRTILVADPRCDPIQHETAQGYFLPNTLINQKYSLFTESWTFQSIIKRLLKNICPESSNSHKKISKTPLPKKKARAMSTDRHCARAPFQRPSGAGVGRAAIPGKIVACSKRTHSRCEIRFLYFYKSENNRITIAQNNRQKPIDDPITSSPFSRSAYSIFGIRFAGVWMSVRLVICSVCGGMMFAGSMEG